MLVYALMFAMFSDSLYKGTDTPNTAVSMLVTKGDAPVDDLPPFSVLARYGIENYATIAPGLMNYGVDSENPLSFLDMNSADPRTILSMNVVVDGMGYFELVLGRDYQRNADVIIVNNDYCLIKRKETIQEQVGPFTTETLIRETVTRVTRNDPTSAELITTTFQSAAEPAGIYGKCTDEFQDEERLRNLLTNHPFGSQIALPSAGEMAMGHCEAMGTDLTDTIRTSLNTGYFLVLSDLVMAYRPGQPNPEYADEVAYVRALLMAFIDGQVQM